MKRKTSDLSTDTLTFNRWQEDVATSCPTSVPGGGRAATDLRNVRAGACATVVAAVQIIILAALLSGRVNGSERIDEWVRQIKIANALVEKGALNEAQAVYTKALDDAQIAGDKVRVGVVLQNVGRLLDRKGQLREAEKAYLRAVSAFRSAGAANERLVIRAYVGLSAVYIQTGQYSKAETLIRRVLADQPAGAESDQASLMGSLGVILAHKHKLAEAEQLLEKTVELSAGDSTEMQEVRAIAMANLAGIQNRVGRTVEAMASYRHALSVMEALPNPSPATLSVTLADYAEVLFGLEHRDAAGGIYQRAIYIAESRLGSAHPILGGLLQKYAELLRRSGKRSEARTVASAARRIADKSQRENLAGYTIQIESLMVSK